MERVTDEEAETKQKTVREWLQDLVNANASTDNDSTAMETLLRKLGFPSAVVVVGVAYLEGQGPPLDIHSVARVLLEKGAK